MTSPQIEASEQDQRFGQLDPYCLFAVGALALLALVCLIGGLVPIAIIAAVLAVLLLPADKYWNRPQRKLAEDS